VPKHAAPRGVVDSPRAWLVALGSAVANGVAFGTLYTFGAFVESMADEFDSGLGPTALVFGITMFLFFGTGALSGKWSDRYGPRPLLVIGGLLFCGGLVATSQVNALWQGYVVYGLGAGFGGGLFSAPLFAATAGWFVKHRAIAQGVAATGPGLGTLLLVPYAESLIESVGWRESYRVLALIAGIAFVVGFFLMRRPPAGVAGDARAHVKAVVRTRAFRQLSVGSCMMSVALIGAFAFIVTFAKAEGVSSERAALLVGIIGASSVVGRIFITGMAVRLGSVRLLQICFATQPVAYLLWIFAGGNYALLVAFALVLGISYGGFVALMGDVTAHLFGLVGIGAVLGRVYLASGVGSLIGPSLAGFLADATSGRTVPLVTVLCITIAGSVILSRLSPASVRFLDPDPRGTAVRASLGRPLRPIPPAPLGPADAGQHNGARSAYPVLSD
jgi:MFS family permease